MERVGNPVPIFYDTNGEPLDGGKVYFGEPNADPETNPIVTYADPALTVPLEQPIRTIGGFLVNGTTQTFVFVAENDYSQRVRDSNDAQVSYAPSNFGLTQSVQAASPILDALVANGMPTAFGLSLLRLANYAAFKSANNIPDYLPLTGGTLSGNTTHQGAGVELFWADAAMGSGKVYVTAAGAGDPTVNPGDIWLEKSS